MDPTSYKDEHRKTNESTRGRQLESKASAVSRSDSSESIRSLLSLPDLPQLNDLEESELDKRLNRALWNMQIGLGDNFPKNLIRRILRPAGCSNPAGTNRYFAAGDQQKNESDEREAVVRGKRKRSASPERETAAAGGNCKSENEGSQQPATNELKQEIKAEVNGEIETEEDEGSYLQSHYKMLQTYATSNETILCAFCTQPDCPHVVRAFKTRCRGMQCGLCAKVGHPTALCYQTESTWEWETVYLQTLEDTYLQGLKENGPSISDAYQAPVKCISCNKLGEPSCASCAKEYSRNESTDLDKKFNMVPCDPQVPHDAFIMEHVPRKRGVGPGRYCRAFAMPDRPSPREQLGVCGLPGGGYYHHVPTGIFPVRPPPTMCIPNGIPNGHPPTGVHVMPQSIPAQPLLPPPPNGGMSFLMPGELARRNSCPANVANNGYQYAQFMGHNSRPKSMYPPRPPDPRSIYRNGY